MPELVISVVVCTFNRAALLAECLRSLASQTLDKRYYEVIVVNNNSTDDTQGITEEFCQKNDNFSLVIETSQGLSHARNRGRKEAKGEYVAYIDDDARAFNNWCENIFKYILKNPQVEAFGGPYQAYYNSEKPEWYKDEYGSWFLTGEERLLNDTEFINGTNMVYKKSIFQKIGGFSTQIGMTGNKISYGEETNLQLRFRAIGGNINYVPEIIVEHLVLPTKMSLKWMLQSEFNNGLSAKVTFNYHNKRLKLLLNLVRTFFYGIKIFITSKDKYIENRLYNSLKALMWQSGLLLAMLRS